MGSPVTLLDCTIRMTGPEVAGIAGTEDPDERSAELAAVRAGTVGRVHSWELVTGLDGPGTRLTVFLSGCVLRCQYCHNPDTWRLSDGRLTTLDKLMDRIARRAAALKIMHGGVTLSGGEPLVQRPFVTNVLQRCKELGLHTTLHVRVPRYASRERAARIPSRRQTSLRLSRARATCRSTSSTASSSASPPRRRGE